MKRREMLCSTGAALVGLSAFPLGWVGAADGKKQRILYFTRSAGFEHPVVQRSGDKLSPSEEALTELGQKHGFEVECTKDGRVFNKMEDLRRFDVIAFYTSGDLTAECKQPGWPMTEQGVKNLLNAMDYRMGFVAFHAATDALRLPGRQISPFTAMIGGEFVSHGPQQVAALTVADEKFPGLKGLGQSIKLKEEWYALHKFAPDLHVILVQETEQMVGDCYRCPPYPATWARLHGPAANPDNCGRVFYTSLGHTPGHLPSRMWTKEDEKDHRLVQQIMLGGIAWGAHNVDADVRPNLDKVTPKAKQFHT